MTFVACRPSVEDQWSEETAAVCIYDADDVQAVSSISLSGSYHFLSGLYLGHQDEHSSQMQLTTRQHCQHSSTLCLCMCSCAIQLSLLFLSPYLLNICVSVSALAKWYLAVMKDCNDGISFPPREVATLCPIEQINDQLFYFLLARWITLGQVLLIESTLSSVVGIVDMLLHNGPFAK